MNGVGVQDWGVGGSGDGLWLDIDRGPSRVVCRAAREMIRVSGGRMFMVGRRDD